MPKRAASGRELSHRRHVGLFKGQWTAPHSMYTACADADAMYVSIYNYIYIISYIYMHVGRDHFMVIDED